jgi:hypothetical protein
MIDDITNYRLGWKTLPADTPICRGISLDGECTLGAL